MCASHNPAPGIIGRSVQVRQTGCHECCSKDLCNNHLCHHSLREFDKFLLSGVLMNTFLLLTFNRGKRLLMLFCVVVVVVVALRIVQY